MHPIKQCESKHFNNFKPQDSVIVNSTATATCFKPGTFVELVNLRVPPTGKSVNLNYSCCDVAWSPHEEGLIASAATNGAVCLWDLTKPTRSKLDHIFPDHKRQCQKVIFHRTDQGWVDEFLLMLACPSAVLGTWLNLKFKCCMR